MMIRKAEDMPRVPPEAIFLTRFLSFITGDYTGSFGLSWGAFDISAQKVSDWILGISFKIHLDLGVMHSGLSVADISFVKFSRVPKLLAVSGTSPHEC